MDGYWLDAHSDAVPEDVLALARRVVPRLPHLEALIFEIGPLFATRLGLDRIRSVLAHMHEIWDGARDATVSERGVSASSRPVQSTGEKREATGCETPREWEDCLGALVVGQAPSGRLARELGADPGVRILQRLVWEFRAGMLADTLKRSVRLLLATRGEDFTNALLSDFFQCTPPELFASAEADRFGEYIHTRDLRLPYLDENVGFENAALRAIVQNRTQITSFEHEPMQLLDALAKGHLPEAIGDGDFEVHVTPDEDELQSYRGRPVTTG